MVDISVDTPVCMQERSTPLPPARAIAPHCYMPRKFFYDVTELLLQIEEEKTN